VTLCDNRAQTDWESIQMFIINGFSLSASLDGQETPGRVGLPCPSAGEVKRPPELIKNLAVIDFSDAAAAG